VLIPQHVFLLSIFFSLIDLLKFLNVEFNPLLFPVAVASGYENGIIIAAEFCSYHTIENKQVWYLVFLYPIFPHVGCIIS
jgi:hypothetical protein